MVEEFAGTEAPLREDEEIAATIATVLRAEEKSSTINDTVDDDQGWQMVSYRNRKRKQPIKLQESFSDEQSIVVATAGDNSASKPNDEGYDGDGETKSGIGNGGVETKKSELKKPKVTVAQAAAEIDASDLAIFLAEIKDIYEFQEDIQLVRLADYFSRAFRSVSATQFPWMKILKESSASNMVDIPFSHIPEAVYKISTDWLKQRSFEALGSFALWSLDILLADLDVQNRAAEGSKRVVQSEPSKSQVAIFMVLAMTLRQKPNVLISLMPIIRESLKYQGQDKIPLKAWMIAQACQGDLFVGLFMWVRFLLPALTNKSSCSPQSRDLILQSVERILSFPKARPILLKSAVRKGKRLVPPSALDLLMRATFPACGARIKETERLEAVYPILKEIACAGSEGSKAMKQITQQMFQIAIKAAGEGVPDLSVEAASILVWCLMENPECYKLWERIYLDNLEASIVVLGKLANGWKEFSVKHPAHEPLKLTLASFRQKNEKALGEEGDAAHEALLNDVEKHCKILLRQLSRINLSLKIMVFVSMGLVISAAVVMFQIMHSWDFRELL
ncbi:hypothetical protein NMG60_11007530 [Bertholletia excelsa]